MSMAAQSLLIKERWYEVSTDFLVTQRPRRADGACTVGSSLEAKGGAGNFKPRPRYNVSGKAAASAAIFFAGRGREKFGIQFPPLRRWRPWTAAPRSGDVDSGVSLSGLTSGGTSKLAKAGKRDAASVPDVRPDAQEQQSARRVVCPRASSRRRRHSGHRRPRFQCSGFSFVLFSPPTELNGSSPKGAGERGARGLPGYASATVSRGRRPPLRNASRRSSARRAGRRRGRQRGAGGARVSGSAVAQPPARARSREGRGRRSSGRGGGSSRAKRGSAARCLSGARPKPVGVSLRFCRPFSAFERLRRRAPLGALEGAAFSADHHRLFLFRAVADVENAGSSSRVPAPPLIPVALGSRREQASRAALGGGRGVARRGRERNSSGCEPTSAARKDRGAPEPLRCPPPPSAWSPASPTPWPWLR
nr:serine/arginine repetitive matrix protein 1-like [Saimiri boliviensis boliviensis]